MWVEEVLLVAGKVWWQRGRWDIRKGGAGSEVGWEMSRAAADDVGSW